MVRIEKYDGLILVKQNEKVNYEWTGKEKTLNILSREMTGRVFDFVSGGKPLYDGVRCWMYQGIVSALKYNNVGLNLQNGCITLF